jgi:hypothetical protein
MIAQKENKSGIIPIFNEASIASPQCFDTGRKSLRRSSNSKVAEAIAAPAGTPGSLMTEITPEENEPDETRLVSVVRTPLVDSHISGTNIQYDIKILLILLNKSKEYNLFLLYN